MQIQKSHQAILMGIKKPVSSFQSLVRAGLELRLLNAIPTSCE